MKSIDKSFLGTGWSFPVTFYRNPVDVEMLYNEKDVHSSIGIILATITGERIMLPNFGCNLQPYVFETMNVPNIEMIKKIVKEALILHEPRIIVIKLEDKPKQESGLLEINIEYEIITTNTRYNYVFPFYMNEATNIEK